MKISAITISNYKRIKDVRITPDADSTLILLGGKNAQGKSSTLDALEAALGGKEAVLADPVRHGADQAVINIELDGGALTVRRVIQPDGESVLEVRDRLGPVKAPQSVLSKLLGARCLDPLEFIALPPKKQREQLMRLIPDAARIAELDASRERGFVKRTEVGRDLDKARGELARLAPVEIGTAIDVSALTVEARKLDEKRSAADQLERTRAQCERETEQAKATLAATNAERSKLEAELERIKGRIVELGIKSAEWAADVEKCLALEAEATAAVDAAINERDSAAPRRAAIDADLARADAHNRAVYAAEAHMKRRAEAEATVETLTKSRDEITRLLGVIDDRKAEILAAAKLPVEGLSVDDNGVTLNGVPFAQASSAEKLRVALGLATNASPGLKDVWMRDGALLDDESLQLVEQHVAATGCRAWIERVGTRDPGVIVIADGQVAS